MRLIALLFWKSVAIVPISNLAVFALVVKEMTIAPGSKLGQYEILAPVGTGGMGEVWKARDTRLGRIIAIKILNKEHMQRFEREARGRTTWTFPCKARAHGQHR
jgi:serine/threonine protein kinase